MLKDLSLWDKKDAKIMTLSGGMKRRVMIAKALAHEPQILFLDEPTAGVDVELRKDMWQLVRELRASGVTIILTTHYIEEAEEMADRVGVINNGEIILVEDKAELMRKLGKKQLTLELRERLDAIPAALAAHNLTLAADGKELIYTYDTQGERTGITALLDDLNHAGIKFRDLQTTQSSLEDIFVGLVRRATNEPLRRARHLPLRNGADRADAVAEHRFAGDLDVAVFHRVRRRDRLAHHPDRRRQLRLLHRAGPDHADAADAERDQRLVRHLFPALRRHDLRTAVGAGVVVRDRARLCGRGGDQVDHPRARSSWRHPCLFVPLQIAHPVWMLAFLVLTALSFSLFGFILGIWADGFEKLQIVPLLIITPLTFLGGTFYSTSVLPPFWRTVTLFNPLVYLI